MALFREVKLTWQGEDYWVTPSNRILRRMESDGVILASLVSQLSRGEPMLASVSYVVAFLLKEAGADVTEDAVLEELSGGDAKVIEHLAVKVFEALVPQPLDPKKPVARSQNGKKTGRKKKKKNRNR
jgi:hypothetical protein